MSEAPTLSPVALASTQAVQTVAMMMASKGRNTLIDAHKRAAEFHEAMATAIEAERELLDEDDPEYWRDRYSTSLGEAATALQKMPVVWAAILSAKVE